MTAPRDIGVLIFTDFQLLDAAGPIAAFEMPNHGLSPPPYRLHLLARTAGPVVASCGLSMLATAMDAAPPLHTLIVSGGTGVREAMTQADILAFVTRQAAAGARTASVCSGAYILAAAGLLDGRRATTHWRRSADFRNRYPGVRLEPDRIHVRDGRIWTSAGVTAGIDLALALVADDLGEPVARRAAQEMVVYYRRPGGQSQFSTLLELDRPDGRFAGLAAWIRSRAGDRLTVEDLAGHCAMSPRNFSRAFLAETGLTPARAVERIRLELARERIEGGPDSIDSIARQCGFGDPERMRRAFLRVYGLPPSALRRSAAILNAGSA